MGTLRRRNLLAALCSTVALVIWGMIFWGWAYQFFGIFNKLPNDSQVWETLQANDTETGTYFFPWPRNTPETFTNFVQQHRAGPFFQLSYIREGVDPQAPGKVLLGTFQYLLTSLMATGLLTLAAPSGSTFARKFGIVFLAGLMGTIFIRLSDPIWFHLPWPYTIGNAIFELVSWVLLGSLTAWLTRP
jgi:hypothetical protein